VHLLVIVQNNKDAWYRVLKEVKMLYSVLLKLCSNFRYTL